MRALNEKNLSESSETDTSGSCQKAAHPKAAKPIDLNQLVERLGRLRLNLNELLVDALN